MIKSQDIPPNNEYILPHSRLYREKGTAFREVFRPRKGCFFLFPRQAETPCWRFQAHYHDQLEIYLSRSSEGTSRINGKTVRFGRGDCLLVPPGAIHDYDLTGSTDGMDLFMMIDLDHIPGTPPELFDSPAFRAPRVLSSPGLTETIRELYGLMPEEGQTGPEVLRRLSLFYRILEILSKEVTADTAAPEIPADPRQEKVRQIMDYLNENGCRDQSLEEIARECSVSPWHMCRIFREYTSRSITEYRNTLRAERAAVLLGKGMSVTETAWQCGYRSLSYFIRVFREHYGTSPGRYARQATGEKK